MVVLGPGFVSDKRRSSSNVGTGGVSKEEESPKLWTEAHGLHGHTRVL